MKIIERLPRAESTGRTVSDSEFVAALADLAERGSWVRADNLLASLAYRWGCGDRLSGSFERRARAAGFSVSIKRDGYLLVRFTRRADD